MSNEIKELVDRLRCPKIQSCPVDKNKLSCSQCRKSLHNDAADVVEVRHGRWDEVYGSDTIRCSCCRKRLEAYYVDGVPFFETDYCPHCGAKMDGGEE